MLYEDSTFTLQYVTVRWGFFEYTGRYGRVNTSIGLAFDANHGSGRRPAPSREIPWSSPTTWTMGFDDFEDGVYRLAPSITILPLPPYSFSVTLQSGAIDHARRLYPWPSATLGVGHSTGHPVDGTWLRR